jgi:hypothetical protein
MRNPGAVSGVGEFTPSVEGNEEQPDIVPGQLLVAGSGEELMGSPTWARRLSSTGRAN